MNQLKARNIFISVFWFLVNLACDTGKFSSERGYQWTNFDRSIWPDMYLKNGMQVGTDLSGGPIFLVMDAQNENLDSVSLKSSMIDPRFTKILVSCQTNDNSYYWVRIDEWEPVSPKFLDRAVLIDDKKGNEFYVGKFIGNWTVKPVMKTDDDHLIMNDYGNDYFELLQIKKLGADSGACELLTQTTVMVPALAPESAESMSAVRLPLGLYPKTSSQPNLRVLWPRLQLSPPKLEAFQLALEEGLKPTPPDEILGQSTDEYRSKTDLDSTSSGSSTSTSITQSKTSPLTATTNTEECATITTTITITQTTLTSSATTTSTLPTTSTTLTTTPATSTTSSQFSAEEELKRTPPDEIPSTTTALTTSATTTTSTLTTPATTTTPSTASTLTTPATITTSTTSSQFATDDELKRTPPDEIPGQPTSVYTSKTEVESTSSGSTTSVTSSETSTLTATTPTEECNTMTATITITPSTKTITISITATTTPSGIQESQVTGTAKTETNHEGLTPDRPGLQPEETITTPGFDPDQFPTEAEREQTTPWPESGEATEEAGSKSSSSGNEPDRREVGSKKKITPPGFDPDQFTIEAEREQTPPWPESGQVTEEAGTESIFGGTEPVYPPPEENSKEERTPPWPESGEATEEVGMKPSSSDNEVGSKKKITPPGFDPNEYITEEGRDDAQDARLERTLLNYEPDQLAQKRQNLRPLGYGLDRPVQEATLESTKTTLTTITSMYVPKRKRKSTPPDLEQTTEAGRDQTTPNAKSSHSTENAGTKSSSLTNEPDQSTPELRRKSTPSDLEQITETVRNQTTRDAKLSQSTERAGMKPSSLENGTDQSTSNAGREKTSLASESSQSREKSKTSELTARTPKTNTSKVFTPSGQSTQSSTALKSTPTTPATNTSELITPPGQSKENSTTFKLAATTPTTNTSVVITSTTPTTNSSELITPPYRSKENSTTSESTTTITNTSEISTSPGQSKESSTTFKLTATTPTTNTSKIITPTTPTTNTSESKTPQGQSNENSTSSKLTPTAPTTNASSTFTTTFTTTVTIPSGPTVTVSIPIYNNSVLPTTTPSEVSPVIQFKIGTITEIKVINETTTEDMLQQLGHAVQSRQQNVQEPKPPGHEPNQYTEVGRLDPQSTSHKLAQFTQKKIQKQKPLGDELGQYTEGERLDPQSTGHKPGQFTQKTMQTARPPGESTQETGLEPIPLGNGPDQKTQDVRLEPALLDHEPDQLAQKRQNLRPLGYGLDRPVQQATLESTITSTTITSTTITSMYPLHEQHLHIGPEAVLEPIPLGNGPVQNTQDAKLEPAVLDHEPDHITQKRQNLRLPGYELDRSIEKATLGPTATSTAITSMYQLRQQHRHHGQEAVLEPTPLRYDPGEPTQDTSLHSTQEL